jgi:hypothetical protein
MKLRLAAALAVVLVLIGFCAFLVEPYYDNWKLQNYIEDLAYDPRSLERPADALAAAVANRAATMGIPVRVEQVRVTRSRESVHIEAKYYVRIDFAVYNVDLHFRPSAGSK